MVTTLSLIPVMLSFLLLGAHFLRADYLVLLILCVCTLFLLFIRRAWVPRLFQVLLVLGALEWLRALYFFAAMRVAWDQPWTRLAVILGSVALFTALSGLVFGSRRLRNFYRVGTD